MPGAATVCMPTIFRLGRIPVPTITIPKLVVKEPFCDPVRTVFRRDGKVPIVAGMAVAGLCDTCHCLVLGLFNYIAPIVGRLSLAVFLKVALIGRQPVVNIACFLLRHREVSVSPVIQPV